LKCASELSSLGGTQQANLDDVFHATAIVLRLEQAISANGTRASARLPFLGPHMVLQSRSYDECSPIGQAVIRALLRLEIANAYTRQMPLRVLEDYLAIDRCMTETNDWTVTFHILCLCAEIITFCYAEEAKEGSIWDSLSRRLQDWLDSLPPSFEPLHRTKSQTTAEFPQIWLLNDCHGT
jgi:hypothetical protein